MYIILHILGMQNGVSISNELNKFVYSQMHPVLISLSIIGYWGLKIEMCENWNLMQKEIDRERVRDPFGVLKLTGKALKQQLRRIRLLRYWICNDARWLHSTYPPPPIHTLLANVYRHHRHFVYASEYCHSS